LEVRFNAVPVQTGELLDKVGADGGAFTTTVTVPAGLLQPLTVTIKEYVPAAANVAAVIVGF